MVDKVKSLEDLKRLREEALEKRASRAKPARFKSSLDGTVGLLLAHAKH
jgi:hypothetical protein